MQVPQVVIVGQPNVGKSSVFNWLVQKRLAIVDDHPGVTRDRFSYLLCEEDQYFELVDTGGMGIKDVDNLTEDIEQQIDVAIESAHVILFVVDAQLGLSPLDQEVAKRLRYINVPIILVANKADHSHYDSQADEFYKLGRGKMIRTSTTQNRGRDELIDMIMERLPSEEEMEKQTPEEPILKVAIVGRRNTGKSTFVNSLVKAPRMIVSEVPGTTRDSVDVRFELDDKSFIAIDTPGLRRNKSVKSNIDYFGSHRAKRSIRRADVVLLFFDASQRLSKVDKQLCSYIAENYKPCIFVVNKWDLYADCMATEKWANYLRDNFGNMWHVPIAFITGETGKNVKALINHSQMLFTQARDRITTSKLNKLVKAALLHHPPPLVHHRRPKIFYATQVGTEPPTIVLFCNDPKAFSITWQRYLLGVFRDQLSFGEVPIKLYLRRRTQTDTRDEIGIDFTESNEAVDVLEGDELSANDEVLDVIDFDEKS